MINPLWKKTNSRVSTYVVPLPNYSYNYSIIDKIKSFKDKKDYVFELHPKKLDTIFGGAVQF